MEQKLSMRTIIAVYSAEEFKTHYPYMHIVNTSPSNIYLRFAKVFVSTDEYLSAYDRCLRITDQTEAFIAYKQ